MTTDLVTSKAMDQAEEATTEAEGRKLNEGLPDRLRTSGLAADGPPEDDYDYAAADRAGTQFTPQGEGGGINLPNKYANAYVAGRRVSTGEKMQDRNDPNGFGEVGTQRLAGGYTNTKEGPPPDAYDALMPLSIEHLQNGGTQADFDVPYPDEMKTQAFETDKSVAGIQKQADELRAIPPDAPDAPNLTEEQPAELSMGDLEADANFKSAASVVAKYWDFEVDEASLVEDGVEEMAAVFGSMWKMGEIMHGVESGDMPQEVADAYFYMAQQYDRLSMWNMDVLQGSAFGIATDPATYALAGIGSTIFKQAGKQQAVKAMMTKLLSTKTGKVAGSMAVASAASGVESGMIGGGGEATRQSLAGQGYDMPLVLQKAQNDAVAGAIFGAPFGALLSRPGREGVRHAYHTISDMVGRTGSPLKNQGGWVAAPDAKAYNDMPTLQLDDLGQPMADAGGDAYYSKLYDTAVDSGLIGAKETDPGKYLNLLQARMRKGQFKGYELQDSRLEEFLQGKVDAGEKVTKDEVSDYLWANRPRVNSLISTADDYTGPGSENLAPKNIKKLRRSGAVAVMKDVMFETQKVTRDGKEAWQITNRMTGETEITTDPGNLLHDSVKAAVKGLSDDQVVQLIRENDKNQLLAAPRWGSEIGELGTPTIVKGENANNYQEMRLFIPYNGLKSDADIAMERFNKPVSELTAAEKKRVERIKGYANAPENNYRDDVHYPLEHNRLAHVRTQELYTPSGERVLGVNEIQSDMHRTLKAWAKETDGGKIDIEDAEGDIMRGPSKQAVEGWVSMTLNRTMQLAEKQGYNKVAFPVDREMIDSIQLWKKESDKVQGVYNFYDTLAKTIKKDKTLAESWGITNVKMESVASDAGGTPIDQQMLMITFDPDKAASSKPIYGVAAISGAEGSAMMEEE